MYPECYFQGTPYIDEDYAVPTANVSPFMGNNMPSAPMMPYGQPSPMQEGVQFPQTPMYQTPMQTPMQTQMPSYPMQTPGYQAPMTGTQEGGMGAGTGGFELAQEPSIQNDINYTQGYLQTLIGKRVKIEFLIGTDMFIDREGVLLQVGISYVVIREVNTNNLVMCDIYSIKFVNVFNGTSGGATSGGVSA